MKKTESIVARIQKPKEAEASALSKLFPSQSARLSSKLNFDPNDECVSASAHAKKKAFKKKPKTCSITVVLLKKFKSALPKGKERRELNAAGRIKNINFHRLMTSHDVKSVLQKAFRSVKELKSFIVLENEGGSKLVCADYQQLTGKEVVDRRGALYISEVCLLDVHI